MSVANNPPASHNASLNPSIAPVIGTLPLGSSLRSSTSSITGGSSSNMAKRRRLSRLERENPDIDPAILAVIDPHKPIAEQIAKIKAAARAGSGNGPVTPVRQSDSAAHSQNMNASNSVMSFGSSTMSARARRQTSGELGKGDHGAIEAMKRKAAEERLNKQRRFGQSRLSHAGSAISNSDFRNSYSRVSNSSFGMSRIGLHSSTGSARPLSSLGHNPAQYSPSLTSAASPPTSAEKLQGLTYVKSVLARKEASQRSRASTPDVAKPDSPYASIAARARSMLAENTKEIQEERVARRKREAIKQEMERERARRDARMEIFAKLAKEEEDEMARRAEEELVNATLIRKRYADSILRYSPDANMNNSLAKNRRKRSPGVDTATASEEQPAKRTRSSEPDDEMPVIPVDTPKPTDRKLMPPPPPPALSGRASGSQASTNGYPPAFSAQFPTQQTASPSAGVSTERQASPVEQAFVERSPTSPANAKLLFDMDQKSSFSDLFADTQGDLEQLHDFIQGDEYEVDQNAEPFIGQPIHQQPTSSIEQPGSVPIVRDFAYSGEPMPLAPAELKLGSDTIVRDFAYSGEPMPLTPVEPKLAPSVVYNHPIQYSCPGDEDEHRGSDTEPDEPEEDQEVAQEIFEEPEEPEDYEEAVEVGRESIVIDLLDSDTEENGGGYDDEEEEEEEEDEEDEEEDEEEEDEEEDEMEGFEEDEADSGEGFEEEDDHEDGEEEEEEEGSAAPGGFYSTGSADILKQDDKNRHIVEVYSSPPPPSRLTEQAIESTETNGVRSIIPDSFTAGAGAAAPLKAGHGHDKAHDIQESPELKTQARSGSIQGGSRPTSSHQTSQEQIWVRSDDGRLTRSTSPELVDQYREENGIEHPNSDYRDDQPRDFAVEIDPGLLKAGLDASAPAFVHTN